MNYKIVSYTVGRILQIEASLLLLPMLVSIIYSGKDGPESIWAFLITAAISLAAGLLLTYVFGKNNKLLFAREGFAIVALAWILMSAVGALPFFISGEIPNYIDALFETLGFNVAGKTGTAQKLKNGVDYPNHLFIGYAPYYSPQISVACAAQEQKTSTGESCKPLAKKAFELYFAKYGVKSE